MLARMTRGIWRRADEQRHRSPRGPDWPQIASQRQLAPGQRGELVECGAARIVPQRTRELFGGSATRRNNWIVWNSFFFGRTQPKQIRNHTLEFLGDELCPNALWKSRAQLDGDEYQAISFHHADLDVD